MALSNKQKRFCEEFVVDLNATAAYLRAGYTATPESARRLGSNLLTKLDVQAYIQALRGVQSNRTEITADRVLNEIARVAFANLTDIVSFDENGVNFKDSAELSDDIKAAIAEVASDRESRTFARGESEETEVTVKRKIKMHNKMDALKQLMAYLGLTNDFNGAVMALQKYGLKLQQNDQIDSGWEVVRIADADSTSTTP